MIDLICLQSLDEDTAPEHYYLPPEKLIAGNPKQSLWPIYSNQSGVFHAGIWQSEPGKWHIGYSEDEYCELLSGVSIITGDNGQPHTVTAGDRFVVPAGFIGTWEVQETTRKIYVLYETAS